MNGIQESKTAKLQNIKDLTKSQLCTPACSLSKITREQDQIEQPKEETPTNIEEINSPSITSLVSYIEQMDTTQENEDILLSPKIVMAKDINKESTPQPILPSRFYCLQE